MEKVSIERIVRNHEQLIKDVNKSIFDFSELGDKEFKSSKLLADKLAHFGYDVTLGYASLPTAFMASKKGVNPKLVVAILAEYDALPEIGHGCGHNLISSASLATAIGLSEIINTLPLELRIIGTPAEETTAGKITMVDKGIFDDVDCVLMCHPFNETGVNISTLAIEAVEYNFIGRTSHAAGSPEEGASALQAMINFFNNINGMRLHLPKTSSVHGIITHGGERPNIIPALSTSRFNVREKESDKVEKLLVVMENLAKAAALSAGTEYEINRDLSIQDLKTNNTLALLFEKNLKCIGINDITNDSLNLGSSDIGNVSYVVPTLHAMIRVTEEETPLHTKEFAQNTLTDFAQQRFIEAGIAMAYTVYDIAKDLSLLDEMKD